MRFNKINFWLDSKNKSKNTSKVVNKMTNDEEVPTSRLIIKNLPKKCTEKELREKFGSHGHITDCQLKYTSDGKFRQFAFVGFETEQSANDAKKYYDRTYMGSNKLAVGSIVQ